MAGLAFNPNIATALFHNAVNGGKAEAGAFAFFFRRKEWFKDACSRFRIHSVSRVANNDRDVFTEREECLRFSGVLNDRNVPGLDAQAASAWHGVASVSGKVQDNLLQLSPIHLHPTKTGIEQQIERDILAEH